MKNKSLRYYAFWIVGLLVLSLFYVRVRYLTVELSYEVQKKRIEKLELEDKKRKYLLELSTLKNPKRVEKIAKEKFQLGYQKENAQRIYVQK